MSKDTKKAVVGLLGAGLGLDELVRQGARQVIQQFIDRPAVREEVTPCKRGVALYLKGISTGDIGEALVSCWAKTRRACRRMS